MPYQNLIRGRVNGGEPVFGATATTLSPAMIDVYAALGFDYVWLDHEHMGAASSHAPNFESLRRASDAAGIEPMVRIESGDGSEIRKLLDAGIRTFVVPRVETAEEVRQSVKAARFRYEGVPGERGVGDSLVNNWGDRPPEYTELEDDAVFPGIMLENRTALDNIDDILAVPELGFARIGPADLSVSLGHPLETDHPEVIAAIERFLEAGETHGVPIGVNPGFLGDIKETIRRGSCILTLGSEVGAARTVLGEQLEMATDATGRQ